MTPVTAYIALGANLEDPVVQVRAGLAALATLPDTQLLMQSSLYRTAPVGYADQPDFINAVAAVDTELSPRELLDALLAIELNHGRVRQFANAPRTLDLDVLLYDDVEVNESGLTIPHPRMHERAFVLAPLAEIAPLCEIPGHGRVSDLLRGLDPQGVTRLAAGAA
ncbi:MAG TPA: 2-amino-4-hydroxy-6-hydroxymethyldihydropteridine diphosphokinase [Burkholderiales bacterium]|jgi:2-amino-4-hydroxy-6-hydroxymethyldihydropteridine diphosphokinase|nr:2-amino-4-hydroxy-6-hydroxymethyldihydropteridine diphosphokinase [Burkholderiales bacterium]